MDNFNTMINGALYRDDLAEKRLAGRSALNHWFVRNRGVQRNSFPVMYEPTYHIESLQRPVGMNEEHWDPLSEAERHWNEVPAKNQDFEDRRQLWQQKIQPKSKTSQNDFYAQAITAADPYEEQVKSMPRLKAVTAPRAKIENSDIETTASEKVSNIYQFPTPLASKKWQQAGNW